MAQEGNKEMQWQLEMQMNLEKKKKRETAEVDGLTYIVP